MTGDNVAVHIRGDLPEVQRVERHIEQGVAGLVARACSTIPRGSKGTRPLPTGWARSCWAGAPCLFDIVAHSFIINVVLAAGHTAGQVHKGTAYDPITMPL